MKAAAAIGGQVVIPQFKPGDPGTDLNDVAKYQGNDVVRQSIHQGRAVIERKKTIIVHEMDREKRKGTDKNSLNYVSTGSQRYNIADSASSDANGGVQAKTWAKKSMQEQVKVRFDHKRSHSRKRSD
jgi:arginine/lysine/ornithine decarboxylase